MKTTHREHRKPHRIKGARATGAGWVCGICGNPIGKGLSGEGLRHLPCPPQWPSPRLPDQLMNP